MKTARKAHKNINAKPSSFLRARKLVRHTATSCRCSQFSREQCIRPDSI